MSKKHKEEGSVLLEFAEILPTPKLRNLMIACAIELNKRGCWGDDSEDLQNIILRLITGELDHVRKLRRIK